MFRKDFFIELKSKWFWRAVFVELLATTLFVFMITSVHIVFTQNESKTMRHIVECLTTGFSATALVKIFGGISGAHMNPAITCGAYVNGDISSPRGSMYSLVQYTGGVLGAGLTWLLTPEDYRGLLGTVKVNDGVTVAQAFIIEALLTFILTLAVLTSQDRKEESIIPQPIFIGFSYLALHFVGIEFTGGSINPARAFGPSLVRNVWDTNSWLYWVAPYVGSTIAGLLHRFILAKKPEELPV